MFTSLASNTSQPLTFPSRVACEISSGDELLLAELLFNRTFNELTPEQVAALLSCFVFEENSKSEVKLSEELAKPFQKLQSQARLIATISQDSKLPVSEDDYVQKFKPQLMEVVYTWSKGTSFAAICKMTDVYEGSLIRMFRRLEELLRQMSLAAKVMGSTELEEKFDQSLEKIKRGMHISFRFHFPARFYGSLTVNHRYRECGFSISVRLVVFRRISKW